jgi:hypothetical protein
MIKTVTIYLSLLIAMYLLGSFIAWTLNPIQWLWVGRSVFVIFYVFLVIAIDLKNNK